MLVPKGLDADRLAVVLDMLAWALKPDQQAFAFTTGGFYPGPAVQGVTLDQAPADVREPLKEFLRPEYDAAIAGGRTVPPLAPAPMMAAFAKWDALIGAKTQAAH
jgi:putative spermidine/putrescine transport system substrate-binding protein